MKLTARMVDKVWGRDRPCPPFPAVPGQRIGEVWFEPPPELDSLLVKYIFTSEKLSIQVHPPVLSPEGKLAGKEECWLVLDAEPDAVLGIGFTADLSPEAMLAAAQDGSIEGMMAWHKPVPGDFYYIPAGTVHAIGGGLSLIEVQINCDVTYRLYDYGRPRDLHLGCAVDVASGAIYDPALCRAPSGGAHDVLADGPWFRVDRVQGMPGNACAQSYGMAPLLVMPLSAGVAVSGEALNPGECAVAPDLSALEVGEDARCLLAQPSQGGVNLAR